MVATGGAKVAAGEDIKKKESMYAEDDSDNESEEENKVDGSDGDFKVIYK